MSAADNDSIEPIVASILLVDDHRANLVAMEASLEPLGQRIVWAMSGAEALAKMATEEFAVVLLDVMMPGLDGFQTARLLQKIAPDRSVPILFVTAGGEEDMRKGYEQGAVDFILKPFDPYVLRAKVRVFVDLFAQRKQIEIQAALLRDRERLFGILGHDLRGPLSSIVLSATVLSKERLDERAARAVRRIATGATRMSRMIEHLVDFSRTRQGGLPIQPRRCDLRVLCRNVSEEVEAGNPNHRITFAAEGDCTGVWDPDRLAQAVSNLLTNAVAYSTAGTPITLTLRDRASAVVLEVTNQGVPIAPEAMRTLFEPFRRGIDAKHAAMPSARAPAAGLGLGLYIVHEIVRAHQGVVRVTSDATAGTTFAVELPRGTSP